MTLNELQIGKTARVLKVGGKGALRQHFLDMGVIPGTEVTLVKLPDNMLDMSNLMAAFLNRDIDTEQMYCFKTKHVVFESKDKIAWTRDGEFGGEHTYVDIRNENKAVTILVPKDK